MRVQFSARSVRVGWKPGGTRPWETKQFTERFRDVLMSSHAVRLCRLFSITEYNTDSCEVQQQHPYTVWIQKSLDKLGLRPGKQ